MTTETYDLVTAAKQRASLAIQNVWKEYHRDDDGLKLLEQKVATSTSRCSGYIFGLAQFAAETCPHRQRPYELFAAMCAYAEAQLKEKHDVDNLAEALPVWKTYKSNILTGMRDHGLDPTQYETEYAFRKAATESRSHSVTTSRSDSVTQLRSDEEEAKITIAPTRKFLRTTTMHDGVKLILAQLVVEAGYIRRGKEEEAAAIITEAREKLSLLVDKRRITDEATRAALSSPPETRVA